MRQKFFSILLVLLLFSFHEVKASVQVKLNELTSFFNEDWGKTNEGEDPSLPFSVSAYFSPCFKFDAREKDVVSSLLIKSQIKGKGGLIKKNTTRKKTTCCCVGIVFLASLRSMH